MNEPPIALIVIFSVVTCVVFGAATLYFLRDKLGLGALFGLMRAKVVAQVDVHPVAPFAFSLRHVARASKLHRICLKMKLESPTGSSSSHGAGAYVGVKCAYQVTMGGKVVSKEVVGYGRRAPEPFDRRITRTYFYSGSSFGSGVTVKGTIILGEIERCPLGEEILIEGTCEMDPGTQAGRLVVSLRV